MTPDEMPDEAPDVPDGVKRLVRAVIMGALTRSRSAGYSDREFYEAMKAEQKLHPAIGLTGLIDKVFARLKQKETS